MKLKKYFETHKTQAEILRFLIVGGLATIVDFFMFGVAMYLMQPKLYPNFFSVFYGGPEPATWATVIGTGIGFCSGLIFSYFMSVKFVFNDKGKSKSGYGFFIFCVLSFIGLGLNLFGMWLGYDIMKINQWIVKIIVSIIVTCYNYVSKKLVLFRKDKQVIAVEAQKLVDNELKAETVATEPQKISEQELQTVLKDMKEKDNGEG